MQIVHSYNPSFHTCYTYMTCASTINLQINKYATQRHFPLNPDQLLFYCLDGNTSPCSSQGILTLIGFWNSALYMEERDVPSSLPGSISTLWSPSVTILCPLHQARGGFTVRPLLVVWGKRFAKIMCSIQTFQIWTYSCSCMEQRKKEVFQ